MACTREVFKRIIDAETGKEIRWNGEGKRPKGVEKSPFWYYEFEIDGIKVCKSSKTTNRRDAGGVKIAHWEQAEATRQSLEKAGGTQEAPKTIGEAFDDLYDNVTSKVVKSEGVRKDMRKMMDEIRDFFGANTLLIDITNNKVEKLVAWRAEQYRWGDKKHGLLTPAQVNRSTIEILRRVFVRAREHWGMVLPNCPKWSNLALKVPDKGKPRTIRADEHAALSRAMNPDYEEVRLFALASGFRSNECLLLWSDIDFNAKVVTTIGKGDKQIERKMNGQMEQILRRQLGNHEQHVFTYRASRNQNGCGKGKLFRVGGERYPITEDGYKTEWRRARKEAAVTCPSLLDPMRRRQLKRHSLRATFLTNAARNCGGNPAVVQELGNHADIKTTMRYIHAVEDDVRAAAEAAGNASLFAGQAVNK